MKSRLAVINRLIFGKLFSVLLLTCLFASSTYIGVISPFDSILRIFSVFAAILVMFVFLINYKHDKFFFVLCLYILFLVISCAVNNVPVLNVLNSYYKIVLLVAYLNTGFKVNAKGMLWSLIVVLTAFTAINLVTIIAFPNGIYSGEYSSANWFLGYKNLHVTFYLPLLVCNYILDKLNNGKLSLLFKINVAIVAISSLYCFSANSVVALFLFLIYISYLDIRKTAKTLSYRKVYLGYIVSFILVVIMRIQDAFSFIIVKVLHRSLSFTGRTFVWDVAIRYINNKKLLGYGLEGSSVVSAKFGNAAFVHCHNTLLDLLYKGGVVSMTLYSVMLYMAISKIKKSKSGISNMLVFAFLCIFLMMLFEARQATLGFYIIYLVANNINSVLDIQEKEGKQKNEQPKEKLHI